MNAQQSDALNRANEIRFARADIRRKLSERVTPAVALARLADVIESEPVVMTMKLSTLLTRCYSIGHNRANEILRHIHASSMLRVQDLTPRQRVLLLNYLRRG